MWRRLNIKTLDINFCLCCKVVVALINFLPITNLRSTKRKFFKEVTESDLFSAFSHSRCGLKC